MIQADIHHTHFVWDKTIAPILRVESGQTLEFATQDPSGGQLNQHSVSEDLTHLEFSRVNPVTGPFYMEEAKPGHVLEIKFNEIKTATWGWTGIIPGFGLLSDVFKSPKLRIWEIGHSLRMDDLVRLPIRPFIGTIGVAPAAEGPHSIVPPRRVGGNMDIRHLRQGSTLYLPVEVPGALLSVGDAHAIQGGGEVCGTAVETSATVSITVKLHKHHSLKNPVFETEDPVAWHKGSIGTTGIGPDLYLAAKEAVLSMIDGLVGRYHISPEDAYMLCSVAGDLRIEEIVDVPNFVVSFHMPQEIFAQHKK